MSWPFRKVSGNTPFVRPRADAQAPIDPQGQRLIGRTIEGGEPIWAPKVSSLLLGAAGANKTTAGLMPWLYSYASSTSPVALLILDSKNGEIARQTADMLAEMGIPVGVIDDLDTWSDCRHRISLNAFDAATAVFERDPEQLIYALDKITHALIEEPPDGDAKNRYWRAWPRLLIEFAVTTLLTRNPGLVTPGGVAALLNDPQMLAAFARIDAEEGDAALQAIARNILGMVGHEHWFQHLEAAQNALRQFRPGTKLHNAGRGATLGHADLIRQGYFIFLIGPQQYIQELGSYYALHIMGFLQAIYGGAGKLRVLAEEFTNAPLKTLTENLTTLRGFGGEVAMVAQSRSEIERRFGKLGTQTIEENSIVKQWFGFSSFDEAERVSKAMGEELAVGASLGADSESLRLSMNLNQVRQRWMSPAELMAMPADLQLIHVKGLGFLVARKIGQQQIAPFCHLVAENPIEGGRLTPDPIITLTTPQRRP